MNRGISYANKGEDGVARWPPSYLQDTNPIDRPNERRQVVSPVSRPHSVPNPREDSPDVGLYLP
jgi:hypothetical protein